MKTAFFGTPALAVPALRALARSTEVAGVVCQPDKPAGRGMKLQAPAVKQAALELGLEVHQPVKVRTGDLHEWLRARGVEAALVLAYGRILPPAVLAAPRLGCLNLHASLLPRYRGAAPIQWALMNGERETGVCLMQMEEGLDVGPVFSSRKLSISEEDTAGTLGERLAELCAEVVRLDLPDALGGAVRATPQEEALATWAPPITREHARIDWGWPAEKVAARVRGLAPRPGAHTSLRGKSLRLGRVATTPHSPLAPRIVPAGTARVDAGRLWVACGDGHVEVLEAQLEGRKMMSARELLNGRAVQDGDVLGGDAAS